MNNRRTPRKPKRLPIFYWVYFALILVFIVLLCFGNALLSRILGEYESVQAKHEAQEVFDTYFADFSYRDMTDYFDMDTFLAESGYETPEELLTALDELTKGGEMTFYQSSSTGDDKVVYAVAVNKTRIATFTLVPDEAETTDHGFVYYKLDSISVLNPIRAEIVTNTETVPPTYLYTYTIVAPQSHVITANGTVLGKDQQKGDVTYDKTALSSSKSDFAGIPTVTYELTLQEPPTLSATDLNGDTVTPVYDEKQQRYTYAATFHKQIEETYSELAIEICQKLGIYMQAGAYFDSIAKYYDPNTELYKSVYRIGADAWMVNKFDSCEFLEIKTSEGYSYSDTEFSIRVSMVQIGHRSGKPDSVEPLDYTFCFHDVGGKWLLYESYNN